MAKKKNKARKTKRAKKPVFPPEPSAASQLIDLLNAAELGPEGYPLNEANPNVYDASYLGGPSYLGYGGPTP